MKNQEFKIEKLPLETLINLLVQLYDNGIDYIDLSSDNSDANQSKLIITTKEGYINPKYFNEEGLTDFEKIEEEDDNPPPSALSDDDIDKLL